MHISLSALVVSVSSHSPTITSASSIVRSYISSETQKKKKKSYLDDGAGVENPYSRYEQRALNGGWYIGISCYDIWWGWYECCVVTDVWCLHVCWQYNSSAVFESLENLSIRKAGMVCGVWCMWMGACDEGTARVWSHRQNCKYKRGSTQGGLSMISTV